MVERRPVEAVTRVRFPSGTPKYGTSNMSALGIILKITSIVLFLYGLWLFSTKKQTKSGYYYHDPVTFFLAAVTNALTGTKTPGQHELKNWEKKGFGIFFIIIGALLFWVSP